VIYVSLFCFPFFWGVGTPVIEMTKNHFIFSFSIPLFGEFLPIKKKANTLDFYFFVGQIIAKVQKKLKKN
jgi:hypothetical protein